MRLTPGLTPASPPSKPQLHPQSPAALLLAPPKKKRSRSRGWLLLPALGGGLAIACGIVLLRDEHEVRTVSQVVRDMQQTALQISDTPGLDNGGAVGPWWISASAANPYTGKLTDFRVRSGHMMIAARTAEVVIDAERDTFSFVLNGVVFTRVPERDEVVENEHYILELATHTLGPAPYGIDIVPDADLATTIAPASLSQRE